MAKTKALRNALIADLQDIDGEGLFVTDLTAGEITTEPKQRTFLRFPAVAIAPGERGASEEPDTLSGATGIAAQSFDLEVTVASETPHDAIQDLLDDIRNAMERKTGSNLCAVDGVLFVVVDGWERDEEQDKQTAQQRAVIKVSVTVKYGYTRGSV